MPVVGGGLRTKFALDKTSFLAGLKKAEIVYNNRAKAAIKAGAILYESEIKRELSKPGTGRKYKRGNGRYHVASEPGQPPAVDFGRLKSSIAHLIEKEFLAYVAKVGSNVKYARILEYGGYAGRYKSTYIAPRPYMFTTLERIRPRLVALFAAILSGGGL